MHKNDSENEHRVPMRQFTHASPPSKSRFSTRIGTCWYILAPLLIIAFISLLGVFSAIAYLKKDSARHSTDSTQQPFYSNNGMIDNNLLIDAYLARKGLRLYKAREYTVQYMGTYDHGGRTVAFRGKTNLFGEGSLELAFGIDEITVNFSPVSVSNSENPKISGELMAIKTIRQSFQDPILVYRLAPEDFEISSSQRTKYGQTIIELELIQKSDETRHLINLDADSLVILERTDTTPSTIGPQLRFYDYKLNDGIKFPTRIINESSSGELISVNLFRIDAETRDDDLASNSKPASTGMTAGIE